MSKLTFDRWDFLGTRVVLYVIALGATAIDMIAPVVQWVRGKPLTWQLQTGRTDDVVTGTWLASIVPGALLAIATVIVVVALLRLLSSIEAKRPFAYAAVRSLRVIGATLLGGAVLVTLAGSFANVVVLDAAVDLRGDTTTFSFDFGNPFLVAAAGLVCAALAEAFAHGIKLADDVEGLV